MRVCVFIMLNVCVLVCLYLCSCVGYVTLRSSRRPLCFLFFFLLIPSTSFLSLRFSLFILSFILFYILFYFLFLFSLFCETPAQIETKNALFSFFFLMFCFREILFLIFLQDFLSVFTCL